MNAFKAGAAFFGLVFIIDYLLVAATFALYEQYVLETGEFMGSISVFLRLNLLVAFPLKLIAAWFISRWLVRRFDITRGLGKSHAPGVVGASTFLLLVFTRVALVIVDVGPPNFSLLLTVDFFGAILLAFFPRFQAPRATTQQLERAKNPAANPYPRTNAPPRPRNR